MDKGHILLVCLLLSNSLALETLPLVLERLHVGPIVSIVVSVGLVLIFGEVVPQAVCHKYGLTIGAGTAWLVWTLIALEFPVVWPLAKLLDALVGTGEAELKRRPQLKALVDLHGEDEEMGGHLTMDETTIISGALDLAEKPVSKAMTPLERVFMLSEDDRLGGDMYRRILEAGHSRIPVHASGDPTNFVGLLLVKELLLTAEGIQVSEVSFP